MKKVIFITVFFLFTTLKKAHKCYSLQKHCATVMLLVLMGLGITPKLLCPTFILFVIFIRALFTPVESQSIVKFFRRSLLVFASTRVTVAI